MINNDSNRVISLITGVILILFASLIAPKLPYSYSKYLENPMVKIILFTLIAYISSKDIVIGIIAVIALLISYQTLSVSKITNDVINKTNEVIAEQFNNIPKPAFHLTPSNQIKLPLIHHTPLNNVEQYNGTNKNICDTRLERDNIQLAINDNAVSLKKNTVSLKKDKIIKNKPKNEPENEPENYDDPENYIDENIFNYQTIKSSDDSYLLLNVENYDKINKDSHDFYLLKSNSNGV
jgi:hypothetical protein